MKNFTTKILTTEKVILFFIIVIGSFLRLQGIFTNSFAFTYDVGRDMINVSQIVLFHKIPLIGATTGLPGLFYGPWWYYILTVPFFLSKGNPQGVAFFIALSGIISIIVGYILGKKIAGKFLGVIFAAYISFSPTIISTASQIWNPNLIPFFSMVIFFILLHLYKETHNYQKQTMYMFFLGIFLGIIVDMEVVAGLLFTLGTGIALFVTMRSLLLSKRIFFLFLGLLLIEIPRIFFELRHSFLMTKTIISFFESIFVKHPQSSLSLQFPQKIVALQNLWDATVANHIPFLGEALLLFICIVLFIYYTRSNLTEKYFLKTLLTILAVTVCGILFFSHDIWDHYLVAIPVVSVFLLSLSINIMGRNTKYHYSSLLSLAIFFILLNPIQLLLDFKKPLWEGDASVYRNQLSVIDYVYTQAHGQQFKYVVYTPPVYAYSYQYLFSWYGKKKYGYTPKEKATLFFLIIEPDYEHPFRLQQWLKDRRGDGRVVTQKKVKGNIIVQTRKVL